MAEARVGEGVRALCVAGARPNFVKIKPVMDGLDARGVDVHLVHTGQHYDRLMSGVFFEDLGIRHPDHVLETGPGSHAVQEARVMVAFEPVLAELEPDVVVVVGDVNSSLACALVAAKSGARVAHVEAGLRSRDWSMPEEVNRVLIDRASDLLLAPSVDAVDQLVAEGYRSDQIHLVGNTMVDSLLANRARARRRPIRRDLGLDGDRYGLATLHRPSNVDDPEVLRSLLEALVKVAERCPLVLPTHPRLAARLETMDLGNVLLIPPIGYLDAIALQDGAAIVLTDSGGIQEETTALGTPCLTLRTSTERPVTVSEGTNRVVGIDAADIVAAADDVLTGGVEPRCPALWDGRAGERIAEVLNDPATYRLPRPTSPAPGLPR